MDDLPPFDTKPVRRYCRGQWSADRIDLVAEVPVALVYNGISHAVMMATPIALDDFAVGFSITEGIVNSPSEITDLDVVTVAQGVEVRLTVTQRRLAALKERRRTLAGRTGCGLCGTESLDAVIRPLPVVAVGGCFTPERIIAGLSALDQAQVVRHATHACHGAVWMGAGGAVLAREDVGRHNALDKVIGAGLRAGWRAEGTMLVVSSRCSVEMVQKAVAAGVPLLAAVAAPTALAVSLADAWGLTLVTGLRPDGFYVATHTGRVEG